MEKVLILSLGRSGSLPIYAENIVSNFDCDNYDILVSKNRFIKRRIKNSIEFYTYTNKFSFVLSTFFYLPLRVLFLLPRIYKDYHTLYLPYKHFWDILFIFIFKLFKRKVVFTVHDGVLHKGEKNFFTQLLSNIRLKNTSEYIFLTNYVKKIVEDKIESNKKRYVIPHPIIENEFVKKESKYNETRNILFLGRIDKYKGIELLMNSAILSESYYDKLIIAGKSNYQVKYIDHSKIEILDKYLTEKEIGDLLSWADLLVLPYTEATQSGVISLGIFSELPMICTNVGGFSEQLEKDECFWSEPNEEDLAAKIRTVFNDYQKINDIKNKLKLKRTKLSWAEISIRIEQVIFN
ncbi:Glycosyltransferase involved in cell wall bisynthesis [Tenacibaculum sp. 190524A02b]|uniref:glycosyltransferase family 4 protein n=1 Tax=Tenacibaculum vairaonense TaxID=3137860 RepID=UPI0032B28984